MYLHGNGTQWQRSKAIYVDVVIAGSSFVCTPTSLVHYLIQQKYTYHGWWNLLVMFVAYDGVVMIETRWKIWVGGRCDLYPKILPTIKRYSVALRETFDFSHHTFKTKWSDGKQFKDIDRILAKRWHVECGTNSHCMHRYLIHVEDSSATKIFLRGLARETFLWRQNGASARGYPVVWQMSVRHSFENDRSPAVPPHDQNKDLLQFATCFCFISIKCIKFPSLHVACIDRITLFPFSSHEHHPRCKRGSSSLYIMYHTGSKSTFLYHMIRCWKLVFFSFTDSTQRTAFFFIIAICNRIGKRPHSSYPPCTSHMTWMKCRIIKACMRTKGSTMCKDWNKNMTSTTMMMKSALQKLCIGSKMSPYEFFSH